MPLDPVRAGGTLSDQVHSSYIRTVADVPCAGRQVTMSWQAHRFRCNNRACSQRIFTERFPAYLRPWARKTQRLGRPSGRWACVLGGGEPKPSHGS